MRTTKMSRGERRALMAQSSASPEIWPPEMPTDPTHLLEHARALARHRLLGALASALALLLGLLLGHAC